MSKILVDQLFGAGKRGGGCCGQQGDPGTGCGAGEPGLKAEQGQTARGDGVKIIIIIFTMIIIIVIKRFPAHDELGM